jgi:hypothetical protein
MFARRIVSTLFVVCGVGLIQRRVFATSRAQNDEDLEYEQQIDQMMKHVDWNMVENSVLAKQNLKIKTIRQAEKDPECMYCSSLCGYHYVQWLIIYKLEQRYPDLFKGDGNQKLFSWYMHQSHTCLAGRFWDTFDVSQGKSKPNLTDTQLADLELLDNDAVLPEYFSLSDIAVWEEKLASARGHMIAKKVEESKARKHK